MSETITTQERLQSNVDRLLARIIQGKSAKSELSRLPIEIFKDEQNILVTTIKTFRGNNIKLDKEFLGIYLSRNPKVILENPCVDKQILNEFNSYPLEEFINLTIRKFTDLEKVEVNEEEETESLVIKVLEDYKHQEFLNSLDIAREIALDGYKLGNKSLIGIEDALDYTKVENEKLKSLSSENLERYSVSAKELYMEQKEQPQSEAVLVSDFGDIDLLNEVYNGGLRSGYFYNILGPEKSGKTKFCLRVAHTAIVKYKTNVHVEVLEGGGDAKAMAELRAIHFDYYYNTLRNEGLEPIGGQAIMDKTIDGAYIELEHISHMDLLNNSEYGTIFLPGPNSTFTIDNFDIKIEKAVLENNCKLILIDYYGLIDYPISMKKHEAISRAYIRSLRLASRLNVAIIGPSQMKDTFVKELSSAENMDNLDTRNAVGESAEISKSADANIALYSSLDDMRNNTVYLLPYLSRIAKPYPKTKLYIDPVCNYFASINAEMESI